MAETRKRHILVVDDDPEITKVVQVMLEYEGFVVTRAHGTAQGMAVLDKELPDLVLLDIMMPHLDGLELCRYIRREPRTMHIPMVVFSASGADEKVHAATLAGATRYLVKTASREELVQTIDEVLGSG